MSTLNCLRLKKKYIEDIAKRYGLSNIFIFGSVARGEDDNDSDIDILVTCSEKTTLFDLGGFYTDIEELLGKNLSVITRDSLKGRIKKNILREAVPL